MRGGSSPTLFSYPQPVAGSGVPDTGMANPRKQTLPPEGRLMGNHGLRLAKAPF
jgi:hypothetical protein